MKTVTHILHSKTDRVVDNVVDLAVWKAEHLAEPDKPVIKRVRPRRRRRGLTAPDWAELAATLAVTLVCLALAVRVLLI